jgi:hypothetical protein
MSAQTYLEARLSAPPRPPAPARRSLCSTRRWPTPPEGNYPAPVEELANKPRRIRAAPLEPEPFLESIPAYRYVRRYSMQLRLPNGADCRVAQYKVFDLTLKGWHCLPIAQLADCT